MSESKIVLTIDDNIKKEAEAVFSSLGLNIETAIDFILKSDLKRLKMIYLIHLSENNSEENYIKESIQKLTGVPVYVC